MGPYCQQAPKIFALFISRTPRSGYHRFFSMNSSIGRQNADNTKYHKAILAKKRIVTDYLSRLYYHLPNFLFNIYAIINRTRLTITIAIPNSIISVYFSLTVSHVFDLSNVGVSTQKTFPPTLFEIFFNFLYIILIKTIYRTTKIKDVLFFIPTAPHKQGMFNSFI